LQSSTYVTAILQSPIPEKRPSKIKTTSLTSVTIT